MRSLLSLSHLKIKKIVKNMLFIDGSIERRKMRIPNGANQNKMKVDVFPYGTPRLVAAVLFSSSKKLYETFFLYAV